MNGQPATQSEARPGPHWTARLDECLPEAPPAAAAWLFEPGLLTERLRACCDGQPGLSVISEAEAPIAACDAAVLQASGNAAFVREIELTCDGRPWVFAQTLIRLTDDGKNLRWLGGGSPFAANHTFNKNFEVQNTLTMTQGVHTIKAGMRARHSTLDSLR